MFADLLYWFVPISWSCHDLRFCLTCVGHNAYQINCDCGWKRLCLWHLHQFSCSECSVFAAVWISYFNNCYLFFVHKLWNSKTKTRRKNKEHFGTDSQNETSSESEWTLAVKRTPVEAICYWNIRCLCSWWLCFIPILLDMTLFMKLGCMGFFTFGSIFVRV